MDRVRRLILIRHCQATGQEPDAALTEAGLRQAESLRDFLAGQPIDAVVASEYHRARQTAEPLAAALGLAVQVDARLNERKLSEKPIDHWRQFVRDSFADPDLRGPGGESAREVSERAWAGLNDLMDHGRQLPAVVTHGNLMSLVLHSLDASFGYEGWEALSNPDVYLLEDEEPGRLTFRRIWNAPNRRNDDMGRLNGKVALISGGARGMGASEARMFAAEGAAVVIGDILDDEGEATVAAIRAEGGRCDYYRLDVTSESDWQNAVAAAVATHGKLNVLVNNAGIGSSPHRIHEEPVELWDATMDVNLKGVFLGTRAVIPAMLESGGGSIINISSQLGIVAVPYSGAAYQTAKGGVRILTKAAALQYAGEGIRVNSVHPGPITTEMTRAGRNDPQRLAMMLARIPMGRYGEPDEVANAVLYLASDESSFVTGSEVVVDGGWTAQ